MTFSIYRISILCGLASSILGLLVLLGWYTHSPTLIQVYPSFVPMQYNTALGFLVCGIGLVATNFSNIRTTQVSGLFLLLLGGLTLVQYIFGPDLGIDQLFMEHYVSVKTSHPGRMAPNTALCFFLVGLSLWMSSQLQKLKTNAKALGILGGLIFALSTVPFFGYLVGVETAYGWSNLTRMAVHTALGFIILGLALVVYAWKVDTGEEKQIPKWLPVLVGIATVTTTILLWQAVTVGHNNSVRKIIQTKTVLIGNEILSELEDRIRGILRIARRWETGGQPTQEEWESDASIYLEHHLSIIRINYIDPEFNVAWVTPLKGNEEFIGKNHSLDKGINERLSKSRDERTLVVSQI